MSIGISDLAFFVKAATKSTQHPISLSHSQQLISSALGYKSLAAYQTDFKGDLGTVRHFIFDKNLLAERYQQLNLEFPINELLGILNEAFSEKIPLAKKHNSFEDFADYLHMELEHPISEHESVVREIGLTNSDGYEGVYFDQDYTELAEAVKQNDQVTVDGQVNVRVDIERPYSGHEIYFQLLLDTNRVAKQLFEDFSFEMREVGLNYSWGEDDEAPKITLAEAYAELTGISVEEAQFLEDAEVEELTGSTGEMTYGYKIDFSDIDYPEIVGKIKAINSTLEFEVGSHFFYNIIN